MLEEPTALTSLGISLQQALRADGIDGNAIFLESGIDPALLKEAEARAPLTQIQEVWRRTVAATGDPAYGLVAAGHHRPSLSHALGQSIQASASIADAINRMQRYNKIVSTASQLRLVLDRDFADVVLAFTHAEIRPQPQGVDFMLAAMHTAFRTIAGDVFVPLRVTVTHPDFGVAERYRAYFGCDVRFDSEVDSMRISNVTLELPNAYGNPELALQIDRISDRYLEKLETPGVSYRVQTIIQQALPSGELTQGEVARRMNRSVSSLRRDLDKEGMTYKALLDKTRATLARAYIREGRHSLTQVAYLLGFSDQANFTRAFRRWTQMAPSEFSRQAAQMES